ncbi:unnamed protein product, partial [Sphenostylis stenocarpa]
EQEVATTKYSLVEKSFDVAKGEIVITYVVGLMDQIKVIGPRVDLSGSTQVRIE